MKELRKLDPRYPCIRKWKTKYSAHCLGCSQTCFGHASLLTSFLGMYPAFSADSQEGCFWLLEGLPSRLPTEVPECYHRSISCRQRHSFCHCALFSLPRTEIKQPGFFLTEGKSCISMWTAFRNQFRDWLLRWGILGSVSNPVWLTGGKSCNLCPCCFMCWMDSKLFDSVSSTLHGASVVTVSPPLSFTLTQDCELENM